MSFINKLLNFTKANILNGSNDVSRIREQIYISPSGGYLNYAIFSVEGINSNTGRKKTLRYKCKTEQEAAKLAMLDGIIDIKLIQAVPFEKPTERQIATCKEHNRSIPADANKIDVSFLMTKDIENENEPGIELLKYADSIGAKFSYFAGKESIEEIINQLK